MAKVTEDNIDEVLDTLWSRLIKVMYPYCWFPNCGKKTEEACHIMKRRHHTTRWLYENGLGGCQFHNQWEEAHTAEAEVLMRECIGSDHYDTLKCLSNEEAHFSFSDKIGIIDRLATMLDGYGLKSNVSTSFKKASKSRYKKEMERFRKNHGGLSPSQIQYRRAKKWKETIDN